MCLIYAILIMLSVHVGKNEAFSDGAKVGYFIVTGVFTLLTFFFA